MSTVHDRINSVFEKLSQPTPLELRLALATCELTATDLEPYLQPMNGFPYSRQSLFQSKDVALLVVNWTPEQQCAPHDHGPHSWGWIVVLEGMALHTVYSLHSGGPIQRKRMLKPAGQIFFAPPRIIHSMGNPSKGKLVTLHAYSPPIQGMRVYDPDRCRSCIARTGCGAWWPDPITRNELTILGGEEGLAVG